MKERLERYPRVFGPTPGRTTWAVHDIDVGEAAHIKLPPYRVNPTRQESLEKELTYMLEHCMIEQGSSEWNSPVTLQPKPDGKVRFCVDFRRVNSVSKTDAYPLPRVDDSIDKVGVATYITKIDLVKGYWQVPLSERAHGKWGCVPVSGNAVWSKERPCRFSETYGSSCRWSEELCGVQ